MRWFNKNVLVTGGAGFLGIALVKRLIDEGAAVDVIDNLSTGSRDSLPKDVGKFIVSDVVQKSTFHDLNSYDIIYHLGSPCSVVQFNEEFRSVPWTIIGFINVLEYAKRSGIKKVVYPSSGSVYGEVPIPSKEDSIPSPQNVYGTSKLCLEKIAYAYSDVLSCLGLRVFAGFGPGESRKGNLASVITLFANEIIRNHRPVVLGDGSQSRDFVYLDDITDCFIRGVENDCEGIINVGSGKSHTFKEVISLINEVLNKRVEPVYERKPRYYLERTLADISNMGSNLKVTPRDFRDVLPHYLKLLEAEPPSETVGRWSSSTSPL